METTYIYGLIDPRTQQLRYVGKASNPTTRLSGHLQDTKPKRPNTYKSSWLKGLTSAGLLPEVVSLESVSIDEWKEAEIWWIAYVKSLGCKLTNGTIGGDGVMATPEVRAKMVAANRGRKHGSIARLNMSKAQLGKIRSPEHRAAISVGQLGKPRSPEVRVKMAEANRERWTGKAHKLESINKMKASHANISEDTRVKMSKAREGSVTPQDVRDKISAAGRGLKRTEETRKNISKGRTGIKFTDEHRANIGKAQVGRTYTEEFKEKVRQGNLGQIRSEEQRARISEATRLGWIKRKERQGSANV
ncbi:MAG: hypothetical protein A2Y38_12385 [Spirochaetes bacterium GWB1_59_5]|nr:MAG: hypothetical protein A2Y38_12385 [Spirochaetes bacterium GWB1_59_5]